MQNEAEKRKLPQGRGIFVNVVNKSLYIAVAFDHHLKVRLAFAPEFSDAAFGLAFCNQVQDKFVWRGIEIQQEIKRGVGKIDGASSSDVPPEGDLPVGKKIEQKFVVLLVGRKISEGLYFFTVALKLADEVFHLVVLLPVLHRKDYTNGNCFFIGLAGTQGLVVLQV